MNEQTIREKISQLNQELAPFKEQRDRLRNEAQQSLEKRDKTREQIEKLRTEIQNIKQQRDEINQKVKDFKIIRDQLVLERKEKLAKVIEYKQKVDSFRQNPTRIIQTLQSEIESLDWKIQTSSLTVQQERHLIEQIAEREKRLAGYKQAEHLWIEIKTLQHQLRALHIQEKEIHAQIGQLAEQSRKVHQTMVERGAAIPRLKSEAQEAHKKYVESRRQAQRLHQQTLPLITQIRALLVQSKSDEEKKKTRRQTELMEEMEKKALEKMKRGEKLSWDEFKILAEKGLTKT